MNRSVILFGPQGCGKTLLSNDLRRHFDLQRVMDAVDVSMHIYDRHPTGTLFLTNARPAWTHDDDRRVVSFFDVAKAAGLLYDPRLVHRRQADGTFLHPHLPIGDLTDLDAGIDDITALVSEQGFSMAELSPPDEVPARYSEYCEYLRNWKPAAPSNDPAWRLAAVVETDDGPRALYVRPFNPVNQTDQE